MAPTHSVPTGPQLDNRRVAAAAIDMLVPLLLAALATLAGVALTVPVLAAIVGWALFYYFALESGTGQTLGKRLLGLRVTRPDGSPADVEQIAKRTIVRILDGHVVGLIVMILTGNRRQRIGDIVAGTVVTTAEAPPDTLPAAARATRPPLPIGARPIAPPAKPGPAAAEHAVADSPSGDAGDELDSGLASAEPVFAPETVQRADAELLGASEPAAPEWNEPEPTQAPVAREAEPFEPDPPAPDPGRWSLDGESAADDEFRIEFDRPAARVEFDSTPDLEREPEPAPRIQFDEPSGPSHEAAESDAGGAADERAPETPDTAESAVVKPIETVSAIDLIMQDAEQRERPE